MVRLTPLQPVPRGPHFNLMCSCVQGLCFEMAELNDLNHLVRYLLSTMFNTGLFKHKFILKAGGLTKNTLK